MDKKEEELRRGCRRRGVDEKNSLEEAAGDAEWTRRRKSLEEGVGEGGGIRVRLRLRLRNLDLKCGI